MCCTKIKIKKKLILKFIDFKIVHHLDEKVHENYAVVSMLFLVMFPNVLNQALPSLSYLKWLTVVVVYIVHKRRRLVEEVARVGGKILPFHFYHQFIKNYPDFFYISIKMYRKKNTKKEQQIFISINCSQSLKLALFKK